MQFFGTRSISCQLSCQFCTQPCCLLCCCTREWSRQRRAFSCSMPTCHVTWYQSFYYMKVQATVCNHQAALATIEDCPVTVVQPSVCICLRNDANGVGNKSSSQAQQHSMPRPEAKQCCVAAYKAPALLNLVAWHASMQAGMFANRNRRACMTSVHKSIPYQELSCICLMSCGGDRNEAESPIWNAKRTSESADSRYILMRYMPSSKTQQPGRCCMLQHFHLVWS